MNFLLCRSCVVLVLVLSVCAGNDAGMLVKTLDALTRSLDYLKGNIAAINLDVVFGTRRVQEQLQSFLKFEPGVFRDVQHWVEVLRNKAKRLADEGLYYVNITQPDYVLLAGSLTKESKKLAWYPSQNTSSEYTEVPVNCSEYFYDAKFENYCYARLSGAIGDTCDVPPDCNEFNKQRNQRFYGLPHRVLYWEFMEGNECVDSVPDDLRMRLCSNVMRDANMIASAGFPDSHTDLFMEQIGICGIWGFRDFNKPEWLEKILDWQQPSGCYLGGYGNTYCFDDFPKESHHRVKREELELEDGCLSHKTTAAMLALTVNVRFEAEKEYQRINGTANEEPNVMLNGMQPLFEK